MKHSISLLAGAKIGTYTIVKELGSGGFGITYLVQDYRGKKFVIKELFIKTDHVCNREKNGNVLVQEKSIDMFEFALKRFVDEAKILEKLHHPSIVKVYNHFFENSTAYYVMEYLHGESLEDYVKSKGRLSEDETIKYIFPILEAVKEMHKLGLWHRDIKPANIMISRDRSVLIDFGTVKVTDAKIFSIVRKKSLFAPYSKTFAAPEQKEDLNLTVDHRTDIYSLGATLFYMLTGKLIGSGIQERFDGGKDYIKNKLSVYSFSSTFKDAIEKSMEIKKEDRFEVIEEMQETLIGQTNPNRKPLSPTPTENPGFLAKNWYLILPMGIVLIIAFVLYFNGSGGGFFVFLFIALGGGLLLKNSDTQNKNKLKAKAFKLIDNSKNGSYIFMDKHKTYTVGRDPSCDIVISPVHNYVSRKHLQIFCSSSSLVVCELKATQGTYINGRKLEPNRDYKWEEGEVLSLVNSDCTYVWEYV